MYIVVVAFQKYAYLLSLGCKNLALKRKFLKLEAKRLVTNFLVGLRNF